MRELALLADCPYCVSHWVALVLVLGLFQWEGLLVLLVNLGVVIAVAALVTGAMLKLLLWDQREVDRLNDELQVCEDKLEETTEALRDLVREQTNHSAS